MGQAVGAGLGALTGAFANQKEGGTDTGNAYGSVINGMGGMGGLSNILSQANNAQTTYQGDPTQQLQNDAVLGKTFGHGGVLDQTVQQEQDLANRGFSLKPEDYEAYGQASGNIARMFGQQEQGLSQSLANRGLSNSGAAAAGFSGLMGNKDEQLAGLQRQIANDRMNMNLQRLGQTQQFLSNLNQQGMQGENQMQQLGRQKAQDYNQVLNNKANMAMGLLGGFQGQQNEGLQQQQQTAHGSTLSNIFGGMSAGYANSGGGMSGGGKPQGTQMSGDPSSSAMSLFA